MRVLGIDPGLYITGYGIVDEDKGKIKLVEAGVIRTIRSLSTGDRLADIARELEGIIAQFKPEIVSIEELYSHYAHPKTAIIMGHARGIVFLKAAEAGIEVVPYAATRIKKSLTGNGRASKAQMQQMIQSTLALKNIPEPADAADALAIALCHALSAQQQAALS
ncbi:MAG: crossover junction endodeoxyribonuclease RuvC [candidate division Zixibacteria bacterium]|nr:crossover junction endodeoxyribonuclease RuvC [candidate division Zixibacteria bacterium]